MKPKAFDYVRAATSDEAVETLARGGEDAKVIAGGMSLVPMLNFRLVEPQILVDVSRIQALDYIKPAGEKIEVGAATRQAALEHWNELENRLPLLKKAFPVLGHYQTRARGTVCGSLAHADPSSELPLCLAVLGGEVVLRSRGGERVLPADQFQTGMLQTARRPDELLVAARYPVRKPGTGYSFIEMAQRRGDFAIVAVAAAVDGAKMRLGVGGVADKPTVREWSNLGEEKLDEALNEFAWDLGASDDIHGTAMYRRQLVRRLGRKTILEAKACRN